MVTINKVAIIGYIRYLLGSGTLRILTSILASGNFGTPITKALIDAGLSVTIITRTQSTTSHPPGIPVIRTEYDVPELTKAFQGQDAVVCVVGPGGIQYQVGFVDAAEAAGVYRFLVDDYGWGPDARGFPEFNAVHAQRRLGWDHAKARAEANPQFTWSGLTTGNPIDWAMKKFPIMGFDITNRSAMIYDEGIEKFTGTTLEGIGQAVLGVLQHPEETANRFLKVRSIQTCQNDLLAACQEVTGQEWKVQKSDTKTLIESGKAKHQAGTSGWVLDLVVSHLFDVGQGRGLVAPSRELSDSDLLGVKEESPLEVVTKAFN